MRIASTAKNAMERRGRISTLGNGIKQAGIIARALDLLCRGHSGLQTQPGGGGHAATMIPGGRDDDAVFWKFHPLRTERARMGHPRLWVRTEVEGRRTGVSDLQVSSAIRVCRS